MHESQRPPLVMAFYLACAVALALPVTVDASVILVRTGDPGFYNDSLGTILNGTNGGNTPTGYFPTTDDSTVQFPLAPDLSTANAVLGNWLNAPLHLNSNWRTEAVIPNRWGVGTEVAVMYQFNTLRATNVVAKFGVDNGIFAWLDGAYLGGARAGGGVGQWEYQVNVGDLDAGTHFLQLLLEDHGVTNGYAVEVTADTFIPGPPPNVPEPGSLTLSILAALGLGAGTMRKRKEAHR